MNILPFGTMSERSQVYGGYNNIPRTYESPTNFSDVMPDYFYSTTHDPMNSRRGRARLLEQEMGPISNNAQFNKAIASNPHAMNLKTQNAIRRNKQAVEHLQGQSMQNKVYSGIGKNLSTQMREEDLSEAIRQRDAYNRRKNRFSEREKFERGRGMSLEEAIAQRNDYKQLHSNKTNAHPSSRYSSSSSIEPWTAHSQQINKQRRLQEIAVSSTRNKLNSKYTIKGGGAHYGPQPKVGAKSFANETEQASKQVVKKVEQAVEAGVHGGRSGLVTALGIGVAAVGSALLYKAIGEAGSTARTSMTQASYLASNQSSHLSNQERYRY